jgi:probable phosphoglycerate mutase
MENEESKLSSPKISYAQFRKNLMAAYEKEGRKVEAEAVRKTIKTTELKKNPIGYTGTVYNCYFDGAISENPGGIMGWGCQILKNDEVVFESHNGAPAHGDNSNNVAEYKGLEMIFDYLLSESTEKGYPVIFGDSMMVIKQMTGRYKIGTEGLYVEMAKICKEKLELVKKKFKIKNVSQNPFFQWIPRDENEVVDALSKEGLKVGAKL